MDLSSNYKKKGMALDHVDKRIMRVKRRSVDQRTQRDETFMKQRDLRSLAPLKESTEENIQRHSRPPTGNLKTRQAKVAPAKKENKTKVVPKPSVPAPVENVGSLARREMLQKWKKEREVKRTLAKEKEKQKPVFKVFKVTAAKKPTDLGACATRKHPAPKKAEKAVPQPVRRVTRSSANTSNSKPVTSHSKPAAPVAVPAKRTTRQSSRLEASKAKVDRNNKSQMTVSTKKNKEAHPSPRSTQHITSERGQSFQTDDDLKQSFAPTNFNFNFQFEPLSPASTQKFLFPDTAVRKGRCSTPLSSRRRKRDPSPDQPLEISAIQQPQSPTNEQDVSYFRSLLETETTKLNDLSSKWEAIQEAEMFSEEVSGEIRSTIGKAQLLIAQRFKQFSGLVDNCESGLGEKKTHCSDLTGFWEMIYFQVEDVHGMFASLDKLQENDWKKEEPKKVSVKPKKIVKKAKPSTTASKPNKDREAARERFAALKAAMKVKVTRSRASQQVVFEGGFFKVESPVRKPAPHCEAGSPFRTQPARVSGAPGSNTSTPQFQSYTPKNKCRSIQGKLGTPLSKLVLGQAAARSSLSTSKGRAATPAATPIETESATPLHNTVPEMLFATPRHSSNSPQENETENVFAMYLQPSAVSVVNLNDQAEGLMMTSPQQQLVDLGVRSEPQDPSHQDSDTPRKRSRSKSGLLLAGLNSPHVLRTSSAGNQVFFSDVFTPPRLPASTARLHSPVKS